jgi:uncharacterized protein (DUF58 family)
MGAALRRAERGTSTGSLIFMIGDFNRDISNLESTLGSTRQRHAVVLLPIDDPADWEIPSMGPTVFTGPGGELIEVDTNDRQAHDAYRAAWQARRDSLLAIASRLNLLVLPLRTDEEIHLTLFRNLQRYAHVRTL